MNKKVEYFFQNNRIARIKDHAQHYSIFRVFDTALAEHADTAGPTTILASDQDSSPLTRLKVGNKEERVFSAYGHTPFSTALVGFNGETPEHATQLYLLGGGHHRPYSTHLMRFLRPDSLSPFDKGGINCYAYCGGDPINYSDPSGHDAIFKYTNLRHGIPKMARPQINEGIKASAKKFTKYLKTEEGKTLSKESSKNPLITMDQMAHIKFNREIAQSISELKQNYGPSAQHEAKQLLHENVNYQNRQNAKREFTIQSRAPKSEKLKTIEILDNKIERIEWENGFLEIVIKSLETDVKSLRH